MIDFLVENLLLLPFLFPAYLVLEWVEAHAGDALERKLGRVSHLGPAFGAAAGVVPQCGFAAAAASLYAGGVITAGTLVAVILSTSDELVPVLLSERVDPAFLVKLVVLKVVFALVAGFLVNGFLFAIGRRGPSPHVGELCAHSRCGCEERHGILVPALIHTAEIFAFLLAVSAVVELALHWCGGEEALKGFVLNRPVVGELLAGLVGLVPNCAASAACAEVYAAGGMSAGALVASSLTGGGVGLLVLFRTHRHWVQNLGIVAAVYCFGVFFGWLSGFVLA
ncbi:MAG: arsenic efflux protein [Kiritimatiellae bacterium]|nr:arsenic efflux protein [Kiritimatiellia bacterium]